MFAEFEFKTRKGSDGCDICWQSVPDVHNALGKEMKTNFKGRSVGSQLILMPAGVRAVLLQLFTAGTVHITMYQLVTLN